MKKLILILLSSLFVSFAFGQTDSTSKEEIKILEDKGFNALENNHYEAAEYCFKKLLKIYKKDGEANYLKIITTCEILIFIYGHQGLNHQQFEICKIRHKYLTTKIDEFFPEYLEAVLEFASVYAHFGYIDSAKIIMLEAVSICEKKNIKNCFYIGLIASISDAYSICGKLQDAEKYLEKAKDIKIDVSECFYNLALYLAEAIFLQNKGKLDEALQNLEKIPPLLKIQDLEMSIPAAHYYMQKGSILILQKEYSQAEPNLLKAKKLYELYQMTFSSIYSNILNTLGLIYAKLRITQKAEKLLLNAQNINYKITKTHDNLFNIPIFMNMGLIKVVKDDYSAALKYYKKADKLREKYGTTLQNNLAIQSDIAYIYYMLDSLEQAEKIYSKLLTNHTLVTQFQTTLAVIKINYSLLAFNKGDMKKFEKLSIESIKLFEQNKKGFPDYLYSLTNLIGYYADTNNPDKHIFYLNKANNFIKQQIEQIFTILSGNEKMQLINFIQYIFLDMQYSAYKDCGFQSDASKTSFFEIQLFLKNIILYSDKNITNFAKNSADSTIQSHYKEYIKANQNEEKLLNSGSYSDLDRLLANEKKETAQKNLSKEVCKKTDFTKIFTENTTIEDIKNALKENEVAIEFIKLKDYFEDVSDYYALILFKNSKSPVMIKLFEEKELQKIIFKNKDSETIIKINSLYSYKSGLYDLIWQPIDSMLTGVKKIYFSPGGLLHNISYAALQNKKGEYISKKYKMQQFINLKSICEPYVFSFSKKPDAAIFGDINYYTSTKKMQEKGNSYRKIIKKNYRKKENLERSTINPLKHSKFEIDSINSILKQNKCKSFVYSREDANEESIKKLTGNSPKIIHIATHGEFVSEEKLSKKYNRKELFAMSRNYKNIYNNLSKSCLLFSGAINYINKKEIPDKTDDGILWAYEIANLDLSNTEVVVLSACKTGLGDIKGNEGIFGLQRAFKIAGAKHLIVSLWKVSDKHTYRFMKEFYKNCFKEKDLKTAFNKTQTIQRKKYPNEPYYWAAFVLVQ